MPRWNSFLDNILDERRNTAQDDDSALRIRREPTGNLAFSGQFLRIPVYFSQETAGKFWKVEAVCLMEYPQRDPFKSIARE